MSLFTVFSWFSSDNSFGARNFIRNAPNGAVTSIDNTAIVTISSLAESLSVTFKVEKRVNALQQQKIKK